MPQTTHTPIQDIESAEANAKQMVENVKKESANEVDAFKAMEEKRLENRKSELKNDAQNSLKEEEEKLHAILKNGESEANNQKDKLCAQCKKNEPGIVAWLVEQFLKIAP